MFIPAGTERGARKAGLSYLDAYKLATAKVDMAVKFFLGRENINNPVVHYLSYNYLVKPYAELGPILKVQEEAYKSWLADPFFKTNRVRVLFYHDLKLSFESLPPSYLWAMQELEEETREYEWKRLSVLIGHGRRGESNWNPSHYGIHSTLGGDKRLIPPNIDLVIRTGRSTELPGVLPSQSAYAKVFTIGKSIIEIDASDLSSILEDFETSSRNSGR